MNALALLGLLVGTASLFSGAKRDDAKRDDAKRDDAKRDDAKRDDAKRDDAKRDKPKKTEREQLEREAKREKKKKPKTDGKGDDAEAAKLAAASREREEKRKRDEARRREQDAREIAEKREREDKRKRDEARKDAQPSEVTIRLGVREAQDILNALGATLKRDGLYGPKTRDAWARAASTRGLSPTFARHDGQTSKVNDKTFATLYRESVAAQNRKAAQPAQPAAPIERVEEQEPAQEPQNEPAKPNLPAGYDPAKARSGARALASHLKRKGRAGYDRRLLAQWQTWAGLKPDRLYGGRTRGALLFYGGTDAPPPFTPPLDTAPYVPPA